MLRLTDHDPYDDIPESFKFPAEAARHLGRGRRADDAPIDRGSASAARRVEQAMRSVEQRFKLVREALGFPESDPDRPRAA